MDKIDKDEIDKDALLGNILVRLTVLEKLLMEKNILLPEDLAREAYEITLAISKSILEKSNVPNIEEAIKEIQGNKEKN